MYRINPRKSDGLWNRLIGKNATSELLDWLLFGNEERKAYRHDGSAKSRSFLYMKHSECLYRKIQKALRPMTNTFLFGKLCMRFVILGSWAVPALLEVGWSLLSWKQGM